MDDSGSLIKQRSSTDEISDQLFTSTVAWQRYSMTSPAACNRGSSSSRRFWLPQSVAVRRVRGTPPCDNCQRQGRRRLNDVDYMTLMSLTMANGRTDETNKSVRLCRPPDGVTVDNADNESRLRCTVYIRASAQPNPSPSFDNSVASRSNAVGPEIAVRHPTGTGRCLDESFSPSLFSLCYWSNEDDW